MGQLWTLVQSYLDRQTFHVSERQLAGKLGYNSSSTFSNWRDPKSLPAAQALARFSHIAAVPYQRVLDAALADAGYLPEPRLSSGPVGRPRVALSVVEERLPAAAADSDDHGEQTARDEQGEDETP